MSRTDKCALTAEQQIRLAVFQSLVVTDFYATTNDLAAAIASVSAAIIGEDKQEAAATDSTEVVYEGIVLTDIPEWAEYVAGDSDGDVYFYENMPSANSNGEWYLMGGDFQNTLARLPNKLTNYPLQKLAPRK